LPGPELFAKDPGNPISFFKKLDHPDEPGDDEKDCVCSVESVLSSLMAYDKALVLFSGGQDSTTCLAWALDRFAHVETVGFAYGQRHAVELDARPHVLAAMRERFAQWTPRIGDDHVLTLDVLKEIGGSALTEDRKIEMGANGLPTSFVPGRNILFLTAAAALAYRRGITNLVGGMCETDFSGYPDCRNETIKAVETALNLGMEGRFTIHTPLMWLNKAATWKLAHDLGGEALEKIIIDETVTCYEGDRTHRHEWGFGCGVCPACDLRARGWQRYTHP
jgi:7-cyano-7-deazaguanine synthase